MKLGQKYLIVVVGPTAVGKTAFSIRLARHFNTEILSADSRQFYREMRIGTAFPEPEELEAIKHHFVGNLSVNDDYNVSEYEIGAMALLKILFQSNDVVVLTGGSGLYIDAVCKGIDDLPGHDPLLRKQLKAELERDGIAAFGEKLRQLDPDYHQIVDLNNPNRLLRAVEVCMQTGATYTSFRINRPKERPFKTIKIGLNIEREKLFSRIGVRVDEMMEQGLLDEVRSLQGFSTFNALKTVGYKELFGYLEGKLDLSQAVENIKTNTRRYARRQLTWFRRDREIAWFEPDAFTEVLDFIDSKMK